MVVLTQGTFHACDKKPTYIILRQTGIYWCSQLKSDGGSFSHHGVCGSRGCDEVMERQLVHLHSSSGPASLLSKQVCTMCSTEAGGRAADIRESLILGCYKSFPEEEVNTIWPIPMVPMHELTNQVTNPTKIHSGVPVSLLGLLPGVLGFHPQREHLGSFYPAGGNASL